ncbi:fimbrial protein [Enterobacter dykesii]|uniref:fimbrial protein n=1 Tax=Enterobacter dykesii TaxID=2797506 RepID=UPI0032B596F4
MSLVEPYLKGLLLASFATACLLPVTAMAIPLNFSATLTNGTCSLSLDKSTLPLGSLSLSALTPAQLVNAKPFTLSVTDCTGGEGGTLTPVVVVSGAGVRQDNRWLFRNSDSAEGVGIMVIKSNTPPAHSQSEIMSGTAIQLAAAGKIPVTQSHTFYAGATCVSTTSCAKATTGAVTASLTFTFAYQ